MDVADLVGRIDRLPPVAWDGEAWRHVAAGRPAMSGEGARSAGGRWNPPGSFAVVYLGTTRATVVAEFHRLAARQRLAPQDFLPRTLYRYAVSLHEALDLRNPDALSTLGVSEEQIRRDDLRACQAIGEAAFVCGREGILAPSATGEGEVVAVYLRQLSSRSSVRDQEAKLWETVPPLDGA